MTMGALDVHSHVVPEFVYDILERGTGEYGIAGSPEHLDSAAGRLPLQYPELRTPAAKLAAMDERRLAASVVSLTPHLFVYADEDDPVGFARRANDEIARFADASSRLHGLATVPLGAPGAAAAELRRAVRERGLRGAIIGTGLSSDRPLDAIGLDPLFQAAVELDVPLFVHPFYCGLVREPDLFLHNSLGVPFDTAWAVARLMASGVFDRHPGLRLLLPHGGGALPVVLGRLDNAWRRRAELRERSALPPSGYLDRLWFDSVVHSAPVLRLLADLAGGDRVLLGTDAPYLTGDPRPAESLDAAGLDVERAARAARLLFGLEEVAA